MNLAKFYTNIQHNAELSITEFVEQYLTKQNKHKNRNKKVMNQQPRFKPIEHPPTSPIHTVPPTGTTIITQIMQQEFKKYMSTTVTHYTQPTFNTTATQYTELTFKNHTSTWKSHYLAQNTTALSYQPNTHHTLKHTYTPAPSASHHSSILSSPSPTPQATTHLPYHIPYQPTLKTHPDITHQTLSTLAPQFSHTHQK